MDISNSFFNQKFLVTGASGFIGASLVDYLTKHGSEVHCISRTNRISEEDNIKWWEGSCSDYSFMEKVIYSCNPDVVFHLAGYAHGRKDLKAVIPSFHNNLTCTVNLLTILKKVGCKRVVLAGSMEEPYNYEFPAIPNSPYAASKWACAGYAHMFHDLYDLPIVNTRIFMVYGPRQNEEKLIPYLIQTFLNNKAPKLKRGERTLDWIYIDDIVEGLLSSASEDSIDGQRIDLGTGELISIKKLAQVLYSMIGSDKEPITANCFTEKREQGYAADLTDTRRNINWSPSTSLTEGLKKTIKWYRNKDQ